MIINGSLILELLSKLSRNEKLSDNIIEKLSFIKEELKDQISQNTIK